MAVKLIANYAKRLGLPGYSSHQFSVSIETELQNIDNVAQQSARLYESLQDVVDQQIQKTGFVPPDGYGMEVDKNGAWNCSQKQRELIEKIGKENNGFNSISGTSLESRNRQLPRSTSAPRFTLFYSSGIWPDGMGAT
jgi:hypothetical protein